MSEDASRPGSSRSDTDKYGLRSSIAAIREILVKNAVTESDTEDVLNAQKQKSYQDKRHLQEEIRKQRSFLKDLGVAAEHAKEESKREKAMRLALQEAQTKLEDHKRLLTSQLETTKASQAVMECKIVQFREDLDQQNAEFDKERTQWEELVKVMRSQDDSSKKEIGHLEARYLHSQQETKDAQSQVGSLKKENESMDSRHERIIQGYESVVEKLYKRIEVGQVDTIEGLQKRSSDAESNYMITLEKLRNAREDLLSFRQFSGKRTETILSENYKDQVCTEMESMKTSLSEAEKELVSSRETVAMLEGDSSASKSKTGDELIKYQDDLARAKEDVEENTSKVAELLTKLEGLHGRRSELSKSKVSATEQDLETVRERLLSAKDDVASMQKDLENFRSKKASLLGGSIETSKKRSASARKEIAEGESSTDGEKRRKQS